eukprot:Skav220929  [mRNA]  locus=scaffold3184:86921:98815:+ [translate_table: standard]
MLLAAEAATCSNIFDAVRNGRAGALRHFLRSDPNLGNLGSITRGSGGRGRELLNASRRNKARVCAQIALQHWVATRSRRQIFLAAHKGNLEALRYILDENPAAVKETHWLKGNTALHMAVCQGRQQAVELLLKARASDINLFVINTERGPVPKTLGVSGVDCGVTGYHLLLNGNYTYQGESHGRPFYKSTVAHPEPAMPTPENPLPWYGAIGNLKGFWKTPKFHHTYLYYTGDASGSASSNLDGEWYFVYSNRSDAKDIAKLFVAHGSPSAVNSVPGPAEALPPRKATWNVLCDSTAWNNSDLLTAHQLKLRARGEIESDMSIVTQRQVESKMQGGKERDSGGASLDFLGGADHLGLHYTKQLGRSWETTISNAEESTIETRYSRKL